MTNTISEYVFQVRSYECGPDGFATLPTICNYLQEAASLNAEELGFSKSNFAASGANVSWVLTKIRVQMNRYPRWEEKVTVETWPRGGRHIVAYRDFVLRSGDETIGVATSEWMIIDLSTRKIVPVPEFVLTACDTSREPVLGANPFMKLRWNCQEKAGAQVFRARRGDIDLNGHVNNVHYVEWLIETLPDTALPVGELELAFRSETLAGDDVLADAVEVEPGVWAAHVSASDGREHVVAKLAQKR